jgi:hypothetical protein
MNVSALIKSYGAHLAAYAVSAATIVAGLDPKLVPPQYSFVTALAGVVVTAAHHGYTAAQGSAAVQAAIKAGVAAATKAAPAAAAALALALFLPLSGCASIQSFLNSPAAVPVEQSVVLVAVGTAESKGITAAEINKVATVALAADQGTQATLGAVSVAVNAELASLNLPAADQAAAGILVAALSAAVEAKVGTNADVALAQTDVATILGYVIADTAPAQ